MSGEEVPADALAGTEVPLDQVHEEEGGTPPAPSRAAYPGELYGPNATSPQAIAGQIAAGKTAARGLVKGVLSPITMAADLGIGAVNAVKNHALDLYTKPDTLDTNASDVVEKGLSKAGLPEQGLPAGGLLEGITSTAAGAMLPSGAPRRLATDATGDTGTTSNWWKSATATGGQNQKIATTLWARAIGERAEKLTPEVLGRADDRIGKVLDMTRNKDFIHYVDPDRAGTALSQMAKEYTAADGRLIKNDTVQDLVSTLNKGYTNGEELGNLSVRLGKSAKAAIKNDYELGDGLYAAKRMVDGMIREGVPKEMLPAYDQALSQYRALSQLTARSGNINPGTGNVDAAAIGRYLQRTDKNGYMFGKNQSPAYAVSRLAQAQQEGSTMNGVLNAAPSTKFFKTVARFAPTQLQWAMQVGFPTALRHFANQPGFMPALANTVRENSSDDGN